MYEDVHDISPAGGRCIYIYITCIYIYIYIYIYTYIYIYIACRGQVVIAPDQLPPDTRLATPGVVPYHKHMRDI